SLWGARARREPTTRPSLVRWPTNTDRETLAPFTGWVTTPPSRCLMLDISKRISMTIIIGGIAFATASLKPLDDPEPDPVPNAECPEDVPAQPLTDEQVSACALSKTAAIQAAILGASPVVCSKCENGLPCLR